MPHEIRLGSLHAGCSCLGLGSCSISGCLAGCRGLRAGCQGAAAPCCPRAPAMRCTATLGELGAAAAARGSPKHPLPFPPGLPLLSCMVVVVLPWVLPWDICSSFCRRVWDICKCSKGQNPSLLPLTSYRACRLCLLQSQEDAWVGCCRWQRGGHVCAGRVCVCKQFPQDLYSLMPTPRNRDVREPKKLRARLVASLTEGNSWGNRRCWYPAQIPVWFNSFLT